MTDNEIIRALECHEDLSVNRNACERCPILNHWDCGGKMASNALALINRQKAEIEKRERGLQFLQETIGKNEGRWLDIVAEQRAEAIKEFAERLKEKVRANMMAYPAMERCEEIDNLVKEMEGKG